MYQTEKNMYTRPSSIFANNIVSLITYQFAIYQQRRDGATAADGKEYEVGGEQQQKEKQGKTVPMIN